MTLIALDQPHRPDAEVGELLVVVVVYAANIVQDVRENIRNLVGGRMSHYEALIAKGIEQGLADLEKKAAAQGYDGVLGRENQPSFGRRRRSRGDYLRQRL